MTKTRNFAASAAELQEILTKENERIIKKAVLIFLNEEADPKSVSYREREMIAEKAFFHVIKKAAAYDPSKGAKFTTWAKKVAINAATDELRKLNRDPLHETALLPEDQSSDDDDAKRPIDRISYRSSFECEADSSDRLYQKDMVAALRGIVATYSGRDRMMADMLLAGRTKQEIMAETQMSGGNVDACICRFRRRLLDDLRRAGYER